MCPFPKIVPLIVVLLLLISCTSGESEKEGIQKAVEPGSKTVEAKGRPAPAGASLEILPKEPTRNSVLTVLPTGFDLSVAAIDWVVNDTTVTGSGQNQLMASEVARGDSVRARATFQDRQIYSNAVVIRNTRPEVKSLRLLPETFKPGDMLSVDAVGSDADGDPVTLAYEWTKNGAPAGTSAHMDTTVRRGDSIVIKVTPFDGLEYGSAAVQQIEIRNLPPIITDHKEFSFDGTTYTYQVRAIDPDGDAITYSLESAAEGMSIDARTGLVTWNVPKEFKGTQETTVVANDGNNGIARYPVQFIIK